MKRREFLLGSSTLALTAMSMRTSQAMTDEFVSYDGMGQAALVRTGQVSSLELVEAAIRRIEKIINWKPVRSTDRRRCHAAAFGV